MSLDFDSARLPNIHLKAEHHEWRAQLRRFFEREVIPFAAQWDEAVSYTHLTLPTICSV